MIRICQNTWLCCVWFQKVKILSSIYFTLHALWAKQRCKRSYLNCFTKATSKFKKYKIFLPHICITIRITRCELIKWKRIINNVCPNVSTSSCSHCSFKDNVWIFLIPWIIYLWNIAFLLVSVSNNTFLSATFKTLFIHLSVNLWIGFLLWVFQFPFPNYSWSLGWF